MPQRILIVDDHDVTRHGLRTLLAIRRDWVVCGEAADGEQAVQAADRLAPDLIVMDLAMPRMNGLDATRKILADHPSIKILIFSMLDTEQSVRAVRDSGAQGYVSKSAPANNLIEAVSAVSQGNSFFPGEQ